MPVLIPVAVAVAAAGIGATIAGTAVVTAMITAGIAAGASVLAAELLKQKSKGQSADAVASASPVNDQRQVPVAQAIPARRFAYGRTRAGGVSFFSENTNPNLHLGYLYSDGVIDGFETLYLGDTVIPLTAGGAGAAGTLYAAKITAETALGLPAQTVSAILATAYPTIATAGYRQRGVARCVFTLNWGVDSSDHSALWGGGISPSWLLRGVKVYDPRDVTQNLADATTWKYSTNNILCIAHAATNAWGVALPSAKVDWASVAAAADTCDVAFTFNAVTQKTFQLAGIFQAGASVASQIEEMLSSCAGSISFSDGLYRFFADKARTSVFTVTDADILGVVNYVHESLQGEAPNAGKATYYDASNAGTAGTTPVLTVTAAIAAEGRHEVGIDLKFAAERNSAIILARRAILRARAGRSVMLHTTGATAFLAPNEVITVSSGIFGLVNGTYEVVEIGPHQVGQLVSLIEYVPAIYNDPATYLGGTTV